MEQNNSHNQHILLELMAD